MISPRNEEAVNEAAKILSELIDQGESQDPAMRISLEKRGGSEGAPDAVIALNELSFIVEYKRSGSISSVKKGISQLQGYEDLGGKTVKLLVVPFMTEEGKNQCLIAGISWLDLSGNADIAGPRVRISVHGRENLYKPLGRPRNPFAPKSSRVARVILQGDKSEYRQSELTEITGLNKGNVSRIVSALENAELINRLPDGAIEPSDPELLLDSWHATYDFSKHHILRGHIPARSGAELMRSISERLRMSSIEHAFTGLASAWILTQFLDFRTVTLFMADPLGRGTAADLGFIEREAGANTWMVVPNDEAVFWKSRPIDGVSSVHPIQVYLDLKQQPERARDVAGEVKKLVLEPFQAT